MFERFVEWAGTKSLAACSPITIKLFLLLSNKSLLDRSHLSEIEYSRGWLAVPENLDEMASLTGATIPETILAIKALGNMEWMRVYKNNGVKFLCIGTVDKGEGILFMDSLGPRNRREAKPRTTVGAIVESIERRRKQDQERKAAAKAKARSAQILSQHFDLDDSRSAKMSKSTELLEHFYVRYKEVYGDNARPDDKTKASWSKQSRIKATMAIRECAGDVDHAKSLVDLVFRNHTNFKTWLKSDITVEFCNIFSSKKRIEMLISWDKKGNIPAKKSPKAGTVSHRYDASDTFVPDDMKL